MTTDYSGLLAHYKARQSWYIGVLRVYEGETGAYDIYRRAQLTTLVNSLDDMIAELEVTSVAHIGEITEDTHPTIWAKLQAVG